MAYFVYILLSHLDRKLYVGCTSDIESRLKRHNDGLVDSTKNRRPFSLIYSEKIEDKTEAFNRERFLKSLWGSRFKKKVLADYLNKVSHD
ncbi:MAG: GIY-YIG nuclease family protein [Patescibacteria group bacterium]